LISAFVRRRSRSIPGLLAVLVIAGWGLEMWTLQTASAQSSGFPRARTSADAPTLLFLSDFGVADDAVAICKGVMLGIAPNLRIIDLTHDVTPFDVREGAYYLAQTAPYYPAGTVFVAVVDPGVGTERAPIALLTEHGQIFVGPDNGLFSLVATEQGVRSIHVVSNPDFMLPHPASTFHGRDVFSPCGAKLAAGAPVSEVGPVREDLIRLPIQAAIHERGRIRAEVAMLDKSYGNVWTNVPREMVDALLAESASEDAPDGTGTAPKLAVAVGDWNLVLPLVETFGDVVEGESLAYFNSRNRLSFAINMGDFADRYAIAPGDTVDIESASK
jgi:S-adenosylmethionine hydrolase